MESEVNRLTAYCPADMSAINYLLSAVAGHSAVYKKTPRLPGGLSRDLSWSRGLALINDRRLTVRHVRR